MEKHHVLPRCLGGKDDSDNLVYLTPEEHFLAHQLLIKMNPGHFGLIKAAHLMTVHNSTGRINNKKYGWLKKQFSDKMKVLMSENHPKGFLGRTHSLDTKRKISNRLKESSSMRSKKVYQFDLQGNLLAEYKSISSAADAIGSQPSNIKYCCEKRFNHVKGYLWSYNKKCPIAPSEIHSKRKVQTPDGIFDSVKDVMAYYNFKSTPSVRRRCLSESYPEWNYL